MAELTYPVPTFAILTIPHSLATGCREDSEMLSPDLGNMAVEIVTLFILSYPQRKPSEGNCLICLPKESFHLLQMSRRG